MTDIGWLHFPPLPALRAFEATVRLGGFSAAGRALNVTHAAVAQQVRSLEAHLGLPLVHRDGRKLATTVEGVQLAQALNDGFGTIQSTLEMLKAGGEDRPVTVTVTPIFATNWLMPRLGRFWNRHPDVPVSLRPDPKVLDLRGNRIDLGIRFGMGNWPGVDAELLTSARYVVVGAPKLIEGSVSKDDMARMPWVLEPDWPEQRNWIQCCLDFDPASLRITEFAGEELALSAARQGYGLHITSAALIEEDLKAGVLSVLFDSEEENPGYYIVTPPGPIRKSTRLFMRWLKDSL